jgi:hypothetical protein
VSRLFGYESGDVPGLRPTDAARFLISVFPFILMVLCCTLTFFLKFKDDDNSGAESGMKIENAIESATDVMTDIVDIMDKPVEDQNNADEPTETRVT